MDPFTMMMIGQGLNMGWKLLNPPKTQDPSMLRMTDADVNRMYGQTMAGISRPIQGQLMSSISGIRRTGAMNRLPKGAVMSGIAGAQYRAAQGMGEAGARIMPQIKGMQMQSMIDFYNANQQNINAQSQYNQSFSSDIGYMTQMAILSKAGYFDNPENAAGGAGTGDPNLGLNAGSYGGFNNPPQMNPNRMLTPGIGMRGR